MSVKYIVSPGWKNKGEEWQNEYVLYISDTLSQALGKSMLYLNEMIQGFIDGERKYAISPIYIMDDPDDGWVLWVEEKKHNLEVNKEDVDIACSNYVRIFRYEEKEEFDYDKALRRPGGGC